MNVGEVFDNLVEKYDFNDNLLFEPAIITDYDRQFYDTNKAITYGKFKAQMNFESQPE